MRHGAPLRGIRHPLGAQHPLGVAVATTVTVVPFPGFSLRNVFLQNHYFRLTRHETEGGVLGDPVEPRVERALFLEGANAAVRLDENSCTTSSRSHDRFT